jgi:DNA-binding response OmpR family regulator
MKLLIIEDEQELSRSMCAYLEGEQFFCETAFNYHSAREKVLLYDYACIILDIGLPGGNGLQLLNEWKAEQKMDGVLIISARNSLDDKVTGLNAGADDYLTKPFHLPELAARIMAIVRRKQFSGKNQIQVGGLTIDLNERSARMDGSLLDLTRKEYELLLYFIGNKNKVLPKQAIAAHLWGDEMDIAGSYDFIYTHIKNLRKKMLAAGAPDHIQSIYGIGYKFKESA